MGQQFTITSYLKKSVDGIGWNEDTNFRCETRRYLSWIEGLTTNQYVGGSNPSRRTIELQKTCFGRSFLCLRGFCSAGCSSFPPVPASSTSISFLSALRTSRSDAALCSVRFGSLFRFCHASVARVQESEQAKRSTEPRGSLR